MRMLASHVQKDTRGTLFRMRSRAGVRWWVVHLQQSAVDHDHQGEPGVEVGAKHRHIVHGRAHFLGKDCGLQELQGGNQGSLGSGC